MFVYKNVSIDDSNQTPPLPKGGCAKRGGIGASPPAHAWGIGASTPARAWKIGRLYACLPST